MPAELLVQECDLVEVVEHHPIIIQCDIPNFCDVQNCRTSIDLWKTAVLLCTHTRFIYYIKIKIIHTGNTGI